MIDLTCFNWVQLVKKANLPPNAKYLALYLGTFMNHEQSVAWPSQARISDETGLARSTVVKWLDYLADNEWVIKRGHGSPVLTAGGMQMQNEYLINVPKKVVREMVNLLQGSPSDEQRMSVQQPKVGRQSDTNTNRITSNNNTPEDLAVAKTMFSLIHSMGIGFKEPNFCKWADTVRLIRERDGRTHKEMTALFKWANNDNFWKSNILSPDKLRKHWPKLYLAMNKNKTQGSSVHVF